jgi:hypothetical protein
MEANTTSGITWCHLSRKTAIPNAKKNWDYQEIDISTIHDLKYRRRQKAEEEKYQETMLSASLRRSPGCPESGNETYGKIRKQAHSRIAGPFSEELEWQKKQHCCWQICGPNF